MKRWFAAGLIALLGCTSVAHAISPMIFQGDYAKTLPQSGIELFTDAKRIVDLASDPTVVGIAASEGSIGLLDDGDGTGSFWVKTASSSTGWSTPVLSTGALGTNEIVITDGSGNLTSTPQSSLDHGGFGGQADDDHTQYALLAGRAGSQTLSGGSASGEDLTLNSTAHTTKGSVNLGGTTMVVDETGSTVTVNGTLTVPGAGTSSETVGSGSLADGDYTVVFGNNATSAPVCDYGLVLGYGSSCSATGAMVIGEGISNSTANRLHIGGATNPITTVLVGGDDTESSPQDLTLRTSNATGTNVAGSKFILQSGASTGNGAGGDISFQVSETGTSGSSLNPFQEVLVLGSDLQATFAGTAVINGNLTLGTHSDGPLYVSSNSVLSESVLSLSRGGTEKNMTAVNGGVVYTDSNSMEVTAAGTSGQVLQSNGAAAPTWTNMSAKELTTLSVTGNITIGAASEDIVFLVQTASSAITITLPAVSGVNAGRRYHFKDVSGNAGTNPITLVPDGSDSVEGVASSRLLEANFGSWHIIGDGVSDWWIL